MISYLANHKWLPSVLKVNSLHMKSIPVFFVGILFSGLLMAQNPSQLMMAGNYATVFVFASHVNVRSAPSLDSKVVGKLNTGDRVSTFGRADSDTINGQKGNWTTILHKGKKAYVWGPLLSSFAYRSHENPDFVFMAGAFPQTNFTQIKVYNLASHQTIQEIELKNQYHADLSQVLLLGKKGVPNAKEFLRLYYPGEACGKTTTIEYLVFNGKQLVPFFTETSMGDGGLFESHTIVFPSDPNGEKGFLHVFSQGGEVSLDENTFPPSIKFEYFEQERYRWNGQKLELAR